MYERKTDRTKTRKSHKRHGRHRAEAYKVHHQVRVFDCTVDFVLPELKIALEIDGPIYHGKDKQESQSLRDDIITNKLVFAKIEMQKKVSKSA